MLCYDTLLSSFAVFLVLLLKVICMCVFFLRCECSLIFKGTKSNISKLLLQMSSVEYVFKKIHLGFDIGAEMCFMQGSISHNCWVFFLGLIAGYGGRFPGIIIVWKGRIPKGRKLAAPNVPYFYELTCLNRRNCHKPYIFCCLL